MSPHLGAGASWWSRTPPPRSTLTGGGVGSFVYTHVVFTEKIATSPSHRRDFDRPRRPLEEILHEPHPSEPALATPADVAAHLTPMCGQGNRLCSGDRRICTAVVDPKSSSAHGNFALYDCCRTRRGALICSKGQRLRCATGNQAESIRSWERRRLAARCASSSSNPRTPGYPRGSAADLPRRYQQHLFGSAFNA